MNTAQAAKTTGYSLILMAIIAIYAIGYAFPQFYPQNELTLLKTNLELHSDLYRNMLGGFGIVLLLDAIVSYSLYVYFKDTNQKEARIMAMLRVVYTLVFALAIEQLRQNLAYAALEPIAIQQNFEAFQTTWNIGLILFGGHVFLLGRLMQQTKRIPAYLWATTLVAGISYALISGLKLAGLENLAEQFNLFLALPMIVGELGLACWCLFSKKATASTYEGGFALS